MNKDVHALLDYYADLYNQPSFIEDDPICIPHRYTRKQDIEITAFWTSILAWGQRTTIINKATELFRLMDDAPHDFILQHKEKDLMPFLLFKHRTFQPADALYFIEFLRFFYSRHESLEQAFVQYLPSDSLHVGPALVGFHRLFFSLETAMARTYKHVATPERGSTCKRLNMFLRWMVRKDDRGVDFGLWHQIRPDQLLIPLDVHVERIARKYQLIHRKQTDWLTVLELTDQLRMLNFSDPVRYDFALFGMGKKKI